MDSLHQEIAELSAQVKHLAHLIETLPQQLLSAIALQVPPQGLADVIGDGSSGHKDILNDKNHPQWMSHLGDREISMEWQVRRLTAQLTTAYNRIAALEEELLNRRMYGRP